MPQALRDLLFLLFPRAPIRGDRVVVGAQLKLGQMALLQLRDVDGGAVGTIRVAQSQRPGPVGGGVVARGGGALEGRVAPRGGGAAEGCHLRANVSVLDAAQCHLRAHVSHRFAG